jgi:hypothetical protein
METHDFECKQKDVIQEIREKVSHIDKTLYFGNGKPAMTAQMEVMNNNFSAMEKKIDGALNIGKTIVLAFLGLVAVDVYQMFKSHTAKENVSHASSK